MNSAAILKRAQEANISEGSTWTPDSAGDFIVGRILTYGPIQTQYGDRLMMKISAVKVVMAGDQVKPGTFTVWERSQLKQLWEEKHPHIGDDVAIVFKRETPTKHGNGMKLFTCELEPSADSQPDQPAKPTAAPADDGKVFADDIPF